MTAVESHRVAGSEKGSERRCGEKMSSWAIGSGVVCAAALYLGLAILAPGSVLGGICELIGIVSGVVFVGLIDGD